MTIREYIFSVPGFIPGVPGVWSAGQRVVIDEDTMTVCAITPMALPAGKEQQEEERMFVVPSEHSAGNLTAQLSEAVKKL